MIRKGAAYVPATFHSVVDPILGTGTLYFFRDIDQDAQPNVTFHFSGGEPWHLSGQRPFGWDYLGPSGEREYGLILLALARPIRLVQMYRDLAPIPVRGQETIYVQIYRVQDTTLVPQPGDTFNFQRLAGQPLRWERGLDPFADPQYKVSRAPSLDYATVQPTPNGVYIAHEGGEWNFRIKAPLNEPAAFAYDISVPQPIDGYRILVVRTPNVLLEGGRVIRMRDPAEIDGPPLGPIIRPPPPGPPPQPVVQVYEAVVDPKRLRDVPPPGSPLDTGHFVFREWDEFEQWLSPEARRKVALIETIIGFIPYVGALYDVAQLAFAAATGRNFWGETMHEADYLVLGIVSLLPVALATRQARAVVQSLRNSNRIFRAALAASTQQRILARIDADLLEALRRMPAHEQEKLLQALDGLAKGTATAKQVLLTFDAAVRERFVEAVERLELVKLFSRHGERVVEDPTFKEAVRNLGEREGEFYMLYRAYQAGGIDVSQLVTFFDADMARAVRRFADEQRLLTVFTDDFSHFRHDPLRTRYTAYRSEGKTLSAVEWAKSQTSGQYRRALQAALGDDYVQLINRTLGERFKYEVTPAALHAYEMILNNADAQFYSDLRKLTSAAGIGRLFEVDHLVEKRFLQSLNVTEEVLDQENFFALVVPKNPAVARQIPQFLGIYTHSVKTQMLRELIPHGAEDLYTLQQWWDAHVFVLKKLGATPEVYMKKFADTFADLANSTGQTFVARFDQTEATFDIAKGWGPRRRPAPAPLPLPAPLP